MKPKRLLPFLMLLCAPLVAARPVVVDDDGRAVALERPAARVVSLAPHLTESMYAAGAGDLLVGAIAYSDHPPEARALPRVGTAGGIDLEALLALAPDLVIAWPVAAHRAALARLADLGVPIYRSEPRALEDVSRTLERLGRLTGRGATAHAAARAFDTRHAALRARYAGRSELRVFYQYWERPLMTVNGEHLISKVMRLCGGRNVFGGLPGLAPEIDREAVLAADPEVIVVGSTGGSDARWLEDWRRFSGVSAVARGNLYAIRAEHLQRHTPRILDGAERLCALLDEARARRRAVAR